MNKKNKIRWNVLVFPGGNEIGMEIWRSLKDCKEVRLFSAASDMPNSAPYVYKNHSIIPDVRNKGWLPALNKVIRQNKIDYIFPANAFVIDELNKNRKKLACDVVLPEFAAIEVTRSKKLTLKLLGKLLDCPKTYSSPSQVSKFPVFVKPDMSYGSRGARKVETAAELREAFKRDKTLLIQEYLPGEEYSVDCFSTRKGKLLFCGGRQRSRVDMGTSMDGVLVPDALNQEFARIAQKILKKIPLSGAWFFQMKRDSKGNLKLLEIEARIAGTMVLNRVRGVNFGLLSLYDKSGFDVKLLLNSYEVEVGRALTNRFKHDLKYSRVYMDLDDTIIMHGKLNTPVIRFLYQCVNEGKEIILLSKNLEKDKKKYLQKWRISELFDKIVWLKESDSKAKYINPKGAIFVDDSFAARYEVAKKHSIPTFDSPMLEMLMDERI